MRLAIHLLLALGLVTAAEHSQAVQYQYTATGVMKTANAAATTVLGAAPFVRDAFDYVPFQLRLTIDSETPVVAQVNAIANNFVFPGAVTHIDLDFGGYSISQIRSRAIEESWFQLYDFFAPNAPDVLTAGVSDFSYLPGSGGPTAPLFSSHTVPVDRGFDGVQYDSLRFSARRLSLMVTYVVIPEEPFIPGDLNWFANTRLDPIQFQMPISFLSSSGAQLNDTAMFESVGWTLNIAAVPESSSLSLMLLGLAALSLSQRSLISQHFSRRSCTSSERESDGLAA